MKFIAGLIVVALLFGVAASSSRGITGAITITAVVTDEHEPDEGRTVAIKHLRDKHGRNIGWGDTVCWDLGNSSAQCIGTFVLPHGKLNVAGTRHNQTYFVFSIVGGTGLYGDAGGTLIGNTFALNPRRERLVFLLE